MLWLRLTQLSLSLIIVAAFVLLVFVTRDWFSLVGVAAVTGLAVFVGLRTVDKLSLFQSDVIPSVTASIFPFVRCKLKSYSHSVDPGAGYDLESELSQFLNCVVQHCIESWYYHISECPSPVSDARILISNVTKLLVRRLSEVDRYRFLCKILRLYKEHLNSCGFTEASCANYGNTSVSENATSSNNEPLTEVNCCEEVRYLNSVVLVIASKLLDEKHCNCLLGKEILAQIIVKQVLLKVVDIASKPEWLYNIVADILQDSSSDSFDTTCGHSCTSVPAENDVSFQDSTLYSGFNHVVDHCALCEPQDSATAYVGLAVASGDAICSKDSSSNDDEQLVDLADVVFGSCNDVDSVYTASSNDLDVIEHSTADLSVVKAEAVTTAVSDHRSSLNMADLSQDPIREDHWHPRSNSDSYPTFEQTKSETWVTGSGYNQQLDSTASTSMQLLSDNNGLSRKTVSFVMKKCHSLGSLLPSLKAQDEKQKQVDPQSTSIAMCPMRRRVENQTKDTGARTGCSTDWSRGLSHKSALVKTKSFSTGNPVGDPDVKSVISHSASMNVLMPEPRSDSSTGFLSRRLSQFVRKVSSGFPQFVSGSSGLPFLEADSGPEFEVVGDVETNAAEANEDFALDHQPQSLFDSISISETERDVPISKPYTVYVISVRIILTFFCHFFQ